MAHFAEVDATDVVLRVIVVNDEVLRNARGEESEQEGAAFCRALSGDTSTKWVQASYNARIRARYPGIGYHYDPEADVFYRPKPYPSWELDKVIWDWVAPVPMPEPIEGGWYLWDEATLSWVWWTDAPSATPPETK